MDDKPATPWMVRAEFDALCDECIQLQKLDAIQRRLDERIAELAANGWNTSDLRLLRQSIDFIFAPLPRDVVIRIPILPGQGAKLLAALGWPPTTL